MTTPTKAPAQPTQTAAYETRKFTVDEYYRLAEVGILQPSERVELICGDIVLMPPIGPLHAATLEHWSSVLKEEIPRQFIVRSQNPVSLGEHLEPVPDLAIVLNRAGGYFASHPGPDEILLIIEVSDSTLAYDRTSKTNMYAEAGIPETWIMNLPEDCIEVFTEPGDQGYAQQTIYRRGDRFSPAALADVEFAVADLLPPPPASNVDETEGETQAEA